MKLSPSILENTTLLNLCKALDAAQKQYDKSRSDLSFLEYVKLCAEARIGTVNMSDDVQARSVTAAIESATDAKGLFDTCKALLLDFVNSLELK